MTITMKCLNCGAAVEFPTPEWILGDGEIVHNDDGGCAECDYQFGLCIYPTNNPFVEAR